MQAGTTQQRLSRIERATTAATTAAVQRLFDALGMRLRVTAVPLEDEGIDDGGRDLDRLGEALATVNCLRYDERWGLYSDYIIDPRRRGPLRWIAFDIEFTVQVEPVPPATVTIQVGHRTLRVRSLAEIEARDRDLAEIMSRVRARLRRSGAAPMPG